MERHKLVDALDSLDEIRQVIVEALRETHDPSIMVSSLEVADLTEKRHNHILRDIRSLFVAQQDVEAGAYVRSYDWHHCAEDVYRFMEEIDLNECQLIRYESGVNIGKAREILLGYRYAELLTRGYNVTIRNQLLGRWSKRK